MDSSALVGVIIVQAIASGILCAIVAEAKDRNSGGWIVAGLLFGFLALIAVAGMPVLRRSKTVATEPRIKGVGRSRDVWHCTFGHPNNLDHDVCEECGARRPDKDSLSAQS